ncbi:hypothetical protein PMAYCL1PPCAC_06498 [Pristionchus mayeri]|uniref:C3H1-type domain-containing protein n=1 Tax=Pristionchus mayeri TaxID=1317129 RepID=A0AAN5C409_9BILA|nr:hypothetical protein PMAYCL1PPCAC_06498 [Pristionchus mayeri]
MVSHPTVDRFSVPEETFPDDFIMVPGAFAHSFSLDSTRASAEKEAARPMEQLQNLDPCKITDEERDLVQRFKRRQDAFKTALCDTYRRTGKCSYGETCRFAHNQEELRVPTQPRGRMHPKYKTVLCENFERDSECKYGSRCMYIHRRRDEKNDPMGYNPDLATVSSCFHGQMPGLHSMDHRPPRHDKDRRSYRGSSRGFTPSSHNQTFSNFSFAYQNSFNGDVSLPHYIQDHNSFCQIFNSSSHEKLAAITRTAPSPTNPVDLDGRRSSGGSGDLVDRFSRMKVTRYPKEG